VCLDVFLRAKIFVAVYGFHRVKPFVTVRLFLRLVWLLREILNSEWFGHRDASDLSNAVVR
jgi:hypothetical protein